MEIDCRQKKSCVSVVVVDAEDQLHRPDLTCFITHFPVFSIQINLHQSCRGHMKLRPPPLLCVLCFLSVYVII